jgi:drug/metabolite transporter (DMT)-like permease
VTPPEAARTAAGTARARLEAVLALLYLGVVGMAVAHWFWQVGVARVGAAEAGIALYLEPVATTALAVPLLGESFGPATAAGGLLVLAGVWFAQAGTRETGRGASVEA